MRLISSTLLFLSLCGCAGSLTGECGDKFILLWNGEFREVQVTTLASPYELRGAAAEIYYNAPIRYEGYTGRVARPKLSRTGDGVCVPLDVNSSMALTVYAQFERIYEFDRRHGFHQNISWPRKVGIEINLSATPDIRFNNAHYFSLLDVIAVVPYTQSGLPLAVNGGVLAHEHAHAHFQSLVITPMNRLIRGRQPYVRPSLKPVIEDLENSNLDSPAGLNNFVIRSWNEGFADFYASVFQKTSDLFSDSFPHVDRDLSGRLRPFKSLPGHLGPTQMEGVNETTLRRRMRDSSYDEGTILARLLYHISIDHPKGAEGLLKHVLDRLKDIPNILADDYYTRVFAYEDIVPLVLDGFEITKFGCAALEQTVSAEMMARSFSQCGN